MLDILNVRSFGARGDGIVDDWAAIQAACDACVAGQYRKVYIPGGTYLVSQPVYIQGNCIIYGDGQAVTTLDGGSGDFAVIHTFSPADTAYYFQFRDMKIRRASVGIHLDGAKVDGGAAPGAGYAFGDELLVNITFESTSYAGLWVDVVSLSSSFWNIRCVGGQYGIISTGPLYCYFVNFFNMYIAATTTAAVYIADNIAIGAAGGGQLGVHLYNPIIDGNYGHGIHVYNGTLTLHNPYFESNGITTGNDICVESNWTGSSAGPCDVKMFGGEFGPPGAGTLATGTVGATGSSYNRVSMPSPFASFMAQDVRFFNGAFIYNIDCTTGGSNLNITLRNANFRIFPVGVYVATAQRWQLGVASPGEIPVGGTAIPLALSANSGTYGGAALVMVHEDPTTVAAKAGVYLIRLATTTASTGGAGGWQATLVAGDDIADFSVVAGVVNAKSKSGAIMPVTIISSNATAHAP